MGNCVPAQKGIEPNMKVDSSIDAQGKSLQVGSPIKENSVGGGSSMAKLESLRRSSSEVPCERTFRDTSNREDMFFDSQAWLESDCEDFLSINGSKKISYYLSLPSNIYLYFFQILFRKLFLLQSNKTVFEPSTLHFPIGITYFIYVDSTPPCGTSPIHQSSFAETSQHDKSLSISSTTNAVPELPPSDTKKQLIELFRESFGSDPVDDNQNLQDGVESKPATIYLRTKTTDRCLHEFQSTSDTKKQKTDYSEQCCIPNFARSVSFSERKKRLSAAYRGGL